MRHSRQSGSNFCKGSNLIACEKLGALTGYRDVGAVLGFVLVGKLIEFGFVHVVQSSAVAAGDGNPALQMWEPIGNRRRAQYRGGRLPDDHRDRAGGSAGPIAVKRRLLPLLVFMIASDEGACLKTGPPSRPDPSLRTRP